MDRGRTLRLISNKPRATNAAKHGWSIVSLLNQKLRGHSPETIR
jgi:hypothetical protein